MKIYAITHQSAGGNRILTSANQGRNHYTLLTEAVQQLTALLQNNTYETIVMIYGKQAPGTFGIIETEAYDSGDSKSTIFSPLTPYWTVTIEESTSILSHRTPEDIEAYQEGRAGASKREYKNPHNPNEQPVKFMEYHNGYQAQSYQMKWES